MRQVVRRMLATDEADPSFGASYVPNLPGAYMLVRSHVYKTFYVRSKAESRSG